MRLLILTEGGRCHGLGHVTRCLAMAQAFAAAGHAVEFIAAGDESITPVLAGWELTQSDWRSIDEAILARAAAADARTRRNWRAALRGLRSFAGPDRDLVCS